jgi:hypothetical protein
MKTAVKIFLLSLPLILLAVCSSQAQASDANAPPPPPQAVSSSPQQPGGPMAEFEKNRPMSQEDIANILEQIKQEDPNKAAKLEKLRKENPILFRMEIRRYAHPRGAEPDSAESNRPHNRPGEMDLMGREKIREHMQAKENELMTWLQKNDPAKAKELEALKEKDPPAYTRRIMLEMKNYRQIIETEQTNPALAEVLKKDLVLKQKRNELLDQIKGTTDEAKKKELTAQLKTVVSDRFDLIVQKKQLRYEELKKKLEELQQNVKNSQTELENIKSKKTQQVDQQLKDLLDNSEKIDWN